MIGVVVTAWLAFCGFVVLVRPVTWMIGEHAPPDFQGFASVKIETLRAEGKLWVAVWYPVKTAQFSPTDDPMKVPLGLQMSNGDLVTQYGAHVPIGGPGTAKVLFLVDAEKAKAGTMRFRCGNDETVNLNWMWRSFLH